MHAASAKISICLVVKNEQKLLANCLESVRAIAHEILVVDTGSTDRTIAIAKKFGARVICYAWDGSLGRARNAYVEGATGDWILVLDADEKIAARDLPRLRQLACQRRNRAYYLKLRNYSRQYDILEDWQPNDESYPAEETFSGCPGWSNGRILRFFRREAGIRYEEGTSVHTSPLRALLQRGARIGRADIVIHHFQVRKGGEGFVRQKLRERLPAEIKHTKLFPGQAWNHYNLGCTFLNLERDRQAIESLRRALRLNPRFERAHFALGLIYKEQGRYALSVRHLKRAIDLNSRYADAWVVLGIAHDLSGNRSEALRSLRRAVKLKPHHPLVHNSLGIVHAAAGRTRLAEKHYRRAIQIHPQHPDAFFNLAELHRERGK